MKKGFFCTLKALCIVTIASCQSHTDKRGGVGFAQVGGEQVYTFLNFSTSARQTALGGYSFFHLGDYSLVNYVEKTI